MATYALIPGGGGDPWEWHRLVRELEARGQTAIAVRLPAADDSAGWWAYEVDEIDGGHMVALSHPSELADRLESYRAAVRPRET